MDGYKSSGVIIVKSIYYLVFIKTINRQIVTMTKQDDEKFDMMLSNKVDLFQIDRYAYERLKERMMDYELDITREKIMMDLQLDEFLI